MRSPSSQNLACHISFRPFLYLGPNLYVKLPSFTQYFLGVRLRIASWAPTVLLTDVFSTKEQLFLPQSANKSVCWALCIERTNISNMKEARHLVGHLWLTAPRRIKQNITIYQSEFLGISYLRLQQQDPSLLFVHLFQKLNKFFLHLNFRYQRKHSMSKCLLWKINQQNPSSYWHPIQPFQSRRTNPLHPTARGEVGRVGCLRLIHVIRTF